MICDCWQSRFRDWLEAKKDPVEFQLMTILSIQQQWLLYHDGIRVSHLIHRLVLLSMRQPIPIITVLLLSLTQAVLLLGFHQNKLIHFMDTHQNRIRLIHILDAHQNRLIHILDAHQNRLIHILDAHLAETRMERMKILAYHPVVSIDLNTVPKHHHQSLILPDQSLHQVPSLLRDQGEKLKILAYHPVMSLLDLNNDQAHHNQM
jgi:hypothetical protein